ncbi:hypothetical protein HDU93_005070 [Gonapodya sp. JEL0774]|nr:hypothetical protein HDU93_005070 [Gonapodya sp. JEL0774]
MTDKSFAAPASWSELEIAALKAMKDAIDTSVLSIHQVREISNTEPAHPTPDGVTITQVQIPRSPVTGLEEDATGGFPAEWIEKEGLPADAPVLIYFHGGGYTIMSPRTHRSITTSLALSNMRVLSVDYRMAPEYRYPAPIVDAVNAYRFVLASDVEASKVCLGGDSAGGNLTFATAMYIRDQDVIPQVAGLVTIAPWVDLTNASPTLALKDEFMIDIVSHGGVKAISLYAPADALTTSLVSPIFDEPKERHLPPCITALATVDRILGEDLAFFIRRIEAGECVQVDIYEEQFHIFELFSFLPQTATFHKRVHDFVHSVTSREVVSTNVNWIDAAGETLPIVDGVVDLKRRLQRYLDRAAAQELEKMKSAKETERYTSVVGTAEGSRVFGRGESGAMPEIA